MLIYQKYPFVLLVTGDGAKFTADNLLILRDCIEESGSISRGINCFFCLP